MPTTAIQAGRILPRVETQWRVLPRYWKADAFTLGLALCAVPVSIAIAETLLVAALLFRLNTIAQRKAQFRLPPDPSFYLRSGGLLNHWMIYGMVEVMVFAALLEFLRFYPEYRRHLLLLLAINGVAIFLSLTRMLWVCCLLLLISHLAWRRSKLIWAVPVLPVIFFALAPSAVRFRVTVALNPSYYSNAERKQMLRVGFKMIASEPLPGLGPGRVEALYQRYLSPGDPVPAYHGHLHNNLFQLAAQFGLPVVFAATLFVLARFKHLRERLRAAVDRESQFLCRTAVLGVIGFLAAGMFDYTYGHSLGLILLTFVAITPLQGDHEHSVSAS